MRRGSSSNPQNLSQNPIKPVQKFIHPPQSFDNRPVRQSNTKLKKMNEQRRNLSEDRVKNISQKKKIIEPNDRKNRVKYNKLDKSKDQDGTTEISSTTNATRIQKSKRAFSGNQKRVPLEGADKLPLIKNNRKTDGYKKRNPTKSKEEKKFDEIKKFVGSFTESHKESNNGRYINRNFTESSTSKKTLYSEDRTSSFKSKSYKAEYQLPKDQE